jgi:hypothetical protein
MKSELRSASSSWRTVRLLLGAARKRAAGRRRRQQELLQNRAGKSSTDWGGLGFALTVLFMIVLNVLAAFVVSTAVDSGERVEAERQGKIVVSRAFLDEANTALELLSKADEYLDRFYSSEAQRIVNASGGTQAVIEQKLREAVRTQGTRAFIAAVNPADRIAAEQQGKIAVSREFLLAVYWAETNNWYGKPIKILAVTVPPRPTASPTGTAARKQPLNKSCAIPCGSAELKISLRQVEYPPLQEPARFPRCSALSPSSGGP